jgi:hypothetical protein
MISMRTETATVKMRKYLKVRYVAAAALLLLAIPAEALPLQTQNFASPAYWGMAHSGGAIAEVRNAYWLNPSLASYDQTYVINLNEAFLPGSGIFISELSGHYRFSAAGMIQGGLNFENYGSFDARDAEGILLGSFNAMQYQYFLGYARKLTQRFAAGLHLVVFGNRIETSKETAIFLRYGLSYRFGDRENMLAFSGVTDGMVNRWRASFSHQLEYLPLRLNLDFRWYGDDAEAASFWQADDTGFDATGAALYMAEKFSIAALIYAGENLNLMAGFDLARLNMRNSAFGLDTMLSGLALGGKYRFKQLEFNLGLYHYANFTTMTALGITYIGK